ncbi:MAG: hypothetical protein U0667_18335 [Chloroflexota bacterium]|jgi:hypothetical protein
MDTGRLEAFSDGVIAIPIPDRRAERVARQAELRAAIDDIVADLEGDAR